MKILLMSLFFVFLIIHVGHAQELDFCKRGTVIFEAYYVGVGMSGIQGKRTISKVCSDRTVQYEDLKANKPTSAFYFRSRRLSVEEYAEFLRLLAETEIRNLKGDFKTETSTIDHSEDLLILISKPYVSEINVTNFKPDIEKARKKYPVGLMKLACASISLRENAELVFFFRESNYCERVFLHP
jgi:hypothetical protein